MVYNHYVLLTASRASGEAATVIGVELADRLIPDVEFSRVCWW